MLKEREVAILLDGLCIRLGFCLPPEDRVRIGGDPPGDVRAFTNAVFVAEGLDPALVDRRLYRQVRDMIADAFRQAENQGPRQSASKDLPAPEPHEEQSK